MIILKIMMIKINLGSWNEAPVEAHQETSLADAVNDHCVVHLDLYLHSHDLVMMMMGSRMRMITVFNNEERRGVTLKSCI